MKVKFIQDDPNAKLPFKATPRSACDDVYSVENVTIPPGKTVLVSTGLKVAYIPEGFKIEVFDRSGMGAKGILLGNGVGQVDEDYRGLLKVILFNSATPVPWYKKLFGVKDKNYEIKIGDRIAQIALRNVYPTEYAFTDTFENTVRGAGGFGSTN